MKKTGPAQEGAAEEHRKSGSIKPCPLIGKPRTDCHCYSLNSQNIEAAVYYCTHNHHECTIYQKYRDSKPQTAFENMEKGGELSGT